MYILYFIIITIILITMYILLNGNKENHTRYKYGKLL